MTKHTKGPWLREGTIVYALEHHRWRKGVEEFRNRFSVQVVQGPDMPDEEAEANANLLAAAPELLEALEHIAATPCLRVRDGMTCAQRDSWKECPACVARAALAKARGE